MWKLRFALLFVSLVTPVICRAQASSVPKAAVKKVDKQSTSGHLVPVETVAAPSELANGFGQPFTCDNEGNLYLQSERFGVSGVVRSTPRVNARSFSNPAQILNSDWTVSVILPSARAASCISLSFPTRSLVP
jgi:hypothetical protein